MVNGALHFYAGPRDLGVEQGDALFKLLDRKRIEILAAELSDKIILAPRKIFVCVHCHDR